MPAASSRVPSQAAARDGVRARAGARPRRHSARQVQGGAGRCLALGTGSGAAAEAGTLRPPAAQWCRVRVLTCAGQGSSSQAFKKMPKITEGQIRSSDPGPGVLRFQTRLDSLLDPAGERPRPRRAVGGVAEPSLRGEGLPRTPARRPASASQRFRKPQVPWTPGGRASFEAAFL